MDIINSTNLIGKDLYITQFDTDIAWYSILSKDTPFLINAPATVFSTTMEAAELYGKKITELANEKGALVSTLDSTRTSYPVIGNVIFTVRFVSEPKINFLDKLSRQNVTDLLKNDTDYDVTTYVAEWTGERRFMLHKKGYLKINLNHIKLVRTSQIDQHVAFCLFNAFKMKLEHIQLIKELINNNNGKSFTTFLQDERPTLRENMPKIVDIKSRLDGGLSNLNKDISNLDKIKSYLDQGNLGQNTEEIRSLLKQNISNLSGTKTYLDRGMSYLKQNVPGLEEIKSRLAQNIDNLKKIDLDLSQGVPNTEEIKSLLNQNIAQLTEAKQNVSGLVKALQNGGDSDPFHTRYLKYKSKYLGEKSKQNR
jgi:hypothetical protein